MDKKLSTAARLLARSKRLVARSCQDCRKPIQGPANMLRCHTCCRHAAYVRRRARGYYQLGRATKSGGKTGQTGGSSMGSGP